MNSKTAKLIHRYCTMTRKNYRHAKKAWLRLTPAWKHVTRIDMVQSLADRA